MSILRNVLTFTNVASAGSASLAHGLNVNGKAVVPDEVKLNAAGFTATANDTTVTVTNTGTATASVDVLVEHWYSSTRVMRPDPLAVQPFVSGQESVYPQPSAGVGEVKIYARTTGSDTTGDGSLTNPYRTFVKALSQVPLVFRGVYYTIDITDLGTEDISGGTWLPTFLAPEYYPAATDMTQLPWARNRRSINIEATPTTDYTLQAGDITSQAQDATTGLVTINTNQSYTVNELRGKIAVAGSAYGVIASNTAGPDSSIEVAYNGTFTAPVAIMSQSAALRQSDPASYNAPLGISGNTCLVAINGVALSSVTTGGLALFVPSKSAPGISLGACRMTGHVNGRSMSMSGCYHESGNLNIIDGATFLSCYFRSVTFRLLSGTCSYYYDIYDTCTYLPILNDSYPAGVGFSRCLVRSATAHGITVSCGAHCYLTRVSIVNSTGDAVNCAGSTSTSLTFVTGTGNGGYGVVASDGAHIKIDADTTVTGTSGDIKSGTLAARAYTDFRANPPLKNEIDLTAGTGDGSRIWQP